MKMTMKAAFAVVAMVLGASAASAAPVTSIGALGANDTILWGQLGPAFTNLSGTQLVTSTGGINASVTSAGDTFQRRDQSTGGWGGNFAPGEQLLWDAGFGPDITLTFGTAVRGVGAQIQANFLGAYTAQITLSNGNIFTEAGVASGAADNSAIFLGALDGFADITSIRFNLTAAAFAPNDFAIGRVYLNTTAGSPPTGVPEPVTLSLFGAGLAGAAMLRRRRKNRAD